MKNTTRTLALASLAGVLTTTAQAALPASDGDLLLGFRVSGGATDYLVNIGSISTYLNATSVLSLSLGNVDADLDSLFSSGWNTRADFLWSVSGVQKIAGNGLANNTLLATQSQAFPLASPGLANSLPWARPSSFGAGTPAGKILSLRDRYALGAGAAGQIESANSPFALTQQSSGINSYTSFMPGGINTTGSSVYGFFNDADGIEGSFANGASGAALDLYTMQPGSGAGIYEGTFTIDSSANVTFTPTGVPEPSSILMLSIGAAAVTFVRRRKA